MRWEDNENISFGIPARVVQYEGNLSNYALICSNVCEREETGLVCYTLARIPDPFSI